MKITQTRYNFGQDFTLSKLFIDDVWFKGCPYILEDTVREITGTPVAQWKVKNETAIPVGTYEVKKTWSGRWSQLMWEVTNVAGYAGIRIHPGNTSHDTEGCLITGKERDETHGEVSGSRTARDALYEKMEQAASRGEHIYWTVEGLPK
jgi:hypothetical protein